MAFVTGGKHFGQYTYDHWYDHEFGITIDEDNILVDSYCGLKCFKCESREKNNCGGCVATGGKPFYGKCEIAECAISKHKRYCGECEIFPCEVLKKYSFDREHGDDGARIENCKRIKAELNKKAEEL